MDANLQSALAKLNQGPVQFMFDPDGDPVEVFMDGGLDLSIPAGLEEAPTDIVGVYNLYTNGDDHFELEIAVPESSLNVMLVLYPEGATDGATYVGIGRAAGYSMRGAAVALRIRPWQTRTSAALQIEIWKLVPAGDGSIGWTKTEPHKFSRPFRSLPDLAQNDGLLHGKVTLPSRS